MKKILCFLTLIFIITGCKKDNNNNNNNNNNGGKLILNMSYHSFGEKTVEKNKFVNTNLDTLYTHLGDYITSISPTVFIGKFLDMRLQNWNKADTMWNYGFNIIDNNTPIDSSNRLADFSSNASVNFNLDSSATPPGFNGTFNIFVFIQLFFYQEFELPEQYNAITDLPYLDFGSNNILNNFDSWTIGGNRTGLSIKGGSEPFLAPIFDSTWTGFNGYFPPVPKTFVLGSCDSTYLYFSSNSGQNAQSIDNPLGQGGYIIRSNAFNNITLQSPTNGETKTVYGSMNFNTSCLIQVYAGNDNVPYTSDDVFVYAPNFWERLSVKMTIN